VAAGAPGRLYVVSGAEELRGGEQAAEQAGALGVAIQWMVTVAAALTLLNTLLLSVFERRRELAVLRALGAARRALRRGVLAEGAGIAAIGCAAGVVLGLPLQWVVTAGLSRAAAVQVPAHLAAESLLLVPLAFALVMLAPVLPVRQAARVDAAVALVDR
jgi:putative ABC transport system permease protein